MGSCSLRRALSLWGEGVLWVPPVQEPDTVHRVQHHLHPLLHARLLPVAHGRVLEHQAHAVVPHVRAHRDGELQERRAELLQTVTVTKRALNTTLLDFINSSESYKVFHSHILILVHTSWLAGSPK